jgi:hypothetical protein
VDLSGQSQGKKTKTGRNARVLIDKDDLDGLLVPVGQPTPAGSADSRQVAVEAILALQQQFAGRCLDVEALIEQNRRERERE